MKIIYFLNPKKQKLCGILDEPDDKKDEIVIICHGFASSKDSTTARTIAKELTKRKVMS